MRLLNRITVSCAIVLLVLQPALESDGVSAVQSTDDQAATIFHISSNRDGMPGTSVAVTQGVVEVSTNGGATSVGPGQGVHSDLNEVVIDRLPAPVRWTQSMRISEEDWFSWSVLDGASEYELNVYNGPNQWRLRRVTEEPHVRFKLPPGSYLIDLFARDPLGLPGLRTRFQANLVHVDALAERSILPIERRGRSLRIENTKRVEVRLGSRLHTIGDQQYLLEYRSVDLVGRGSFNVDIRGDQSVFVQYREIVSEQSVSRLSPIQAYYPVHAMEEY